MLFPIHQGSLSQSRSYWGQLCLERGFLKQWVALVTSSPVPSFVFWGFGHGWCFQLLQVSIFISLWCLHMVTMGLVYRPRCCKNWPQRVTREQLEWRKRETALTGLMRITSQALGWIVVRHQPGCTGVLWLISLQLLTNRGSCSTLTTCSPTAPIDRIWHETFYLRIA